MKNEIVELNQLNDKIDRNVAARDRAELAQKEAEKDARINAALDACHVPVMIAAATAIAATMGLANFDLVYIVGFPVLLWVCYQAGTVR